MQLFPFSLKDKTKAWLKVESGIFTTQMVKADVVIYTPHSIKASTNCDTHDVPSHNSSRAKGRTEECFAPECFACGVSFNPFLDKCIFESG